MGLGDVYTLGSRVAGEVYYAHTSSMSLYPFLSPFSRLCYGMNLF